MCFHGKDCCSVIAAEIFTDVDRKKRKRLSFSIVYTKKSWFSMLNKSEKSHRIAFSNICLKNPIVRM